MPVKKKNYIFFTLLIFVRKNDRIRVSVDLVS
jgi:hypothetical protein